MHSLYLIVDIATISIPFLFSFHPKLAFYRYWKFCWPAILIAAFLFIGWDMYFTSLGVWGFTPNYLVGIYVYNIPIEEILFFICIPYACLFTYFCLKQLLKKAPFSKVGQSISVVLIILLLSLGVLNYNRLYTSATCGLLGIFLLFVVFVLKAKWVNNFYFSYIVLLIPFCIVNGILTGTGLKQPIVWYNNLENLGIRIGTIPVEDIFYGMLLIVLNVSIFEYLRNRNNG